MAHKPSRKRVFNVGDRVNVSNGGTVYVITELGMGFACWNCTFAVSRW